MKVSVILIFASTISKSLADSNDVYTWGQGVNGRLGHGDEDDQVDPRVVQTLLGKEVRIVACGPSHTAALNASGELFTWGAGRYASLGPL